MPSVKSKSYATKCGVTYEQYTQAAQQGQKWCSSCRSFHSRDNFGKNRSSSDGLQTVCVKGAKQYSRAYHQAGWRDRRKATAAIPLGDYVGPYLDDLKRWVREARPLRQKLF
jgi:hypothetical protein